MRIYGKRIDVDGMPDLLSMQFPELRRWHAALGHRYAAPLDVLVVGHSIAEGYYAPTLRKRWIEIMNARCKGDFGPGDPLSGIYRPAIMGVGMAAGWTDPWTRVGANKDTSEQSALGLGRKCFLMNNVADSASYTFTGDRFWLLYSRGLGAGGMSVAIDGGAAVNVDTYNATPCSGMKWDSGLLAYGQHTVVVKAVSYGANPGQITVFLEGIIHFNGEHDSGIRWWDGAHAGYQASHFTSGAKLGWSGALQTPSGGVGLTTITPQLAIVQFGTNEYGLNISAAQFKTDLGNVLSVIGAVAPSICLVVDWASGGNKADATPRTDAGWQPYRDVVYQLANERGCAVADEYVLGGFLGVDTYGITQDLVHPNERGSYAIADYLCDILGLPKTAPRRYDTIITSTGTGTVNFTHGLGSYTPQVTVYRRITGAYSGPIGPSGVRWVVIDKDTIQLDFDTYSRAAGEFQLTVTA